MHTPENPDQPIKPERARPPTTEEKWQELAKLKESGEISDQDLDPNFVSYLMEMDEPLRQRDLIDDTGKHALVLTRETFDTLGPITIIHHTREKWTIEPEVINKGDVAIFYPLDLADEEKPVSN